jgi:hypothetical protein
MWPAKTFVKTKCAISTSLEHAVMLCAHSCISLLVVSQYLLVININMVCDSTSTRHASVVSGPGVSLVARLWPIDAKYLLQLSQNWQWFIH